MDVRMIYQFPGTISRKPRESTLTWHWQEGTKDLLAVAYISDVVTYPPVETLSFFLLQAATGEIVKTISSTYRFVHFDELHLAYDPLNQKWLLGDIELQTKYSADHAVIRMVQDEPDEQGNFFIPLFDDASNDMAAHGPFLDFHLQDNECIFLLLKPAQMSWFTPQILRGRVDLSHAQQGLTVLMEADSALLCRQGQASLLVVLQSRWNTQIPKCWGLLTTLYDADYQEERGHKAPELQMPTQIASVLDQPPGNDFEWLGINTTAIAGPPSPIDGSHTWVVGMTMMDVFGLKGRGHTSVDASLLPKQVNALRYLGASGALLQECQNPPGLCIQLCCVETMVIGVDLRAGSWRLWNWEPIREQRWRVMLTLEPQVKRVHVVAEAQQKLANSRAFWLIEELQDGIRISQRDVFTLEEVAVSVTIENVRLPEQQRKRGSLDWYTEINASVYQGKLFFLGLSGADYLVLYQVG